MYINLHPKIYWYKINWHEDFPFKYGDYELDKTYFNTLKIDVISDISFMYCRNHSANVECQCFKAMVEIV